MYVDTIIAGMKNISKLTKRRAVSPVIATVILVAITITVAVAVAYWMSGIAGQYTSFEKVEIQSGYASLSTADSVHWVITLELKNAGTATATLIKVFINEVPVTVYGIVGIDGTLTDNDDKAGTSVLEDGTPILSGVEGTIYVYIGSSYPNLSPGTTVNIKLHSAGGMDYIKLVQLT
uniref:Archaeal Type IV pilin N-terminal domain-containing protein n=1 Tax=viral metagenome TaxID=1070528 RepID=A0A6M3M971_9ZZZZ